MVRAIVFDCFGTLVGTSYFTFRNICPPERLKELSDTRTAADYGYLTRDEYARRIGHIVGMDESRVREAIDQQHVRNEPLIAYAKLLKRTYKTAMLSNVGSEVMDRIFTDKEMNELFDTRVLSCEVGIVKPDRQIYLLTIKKLGLSPEECIMVDDREEFCAGADAAGMRPVLHRTNHETMRAIDRMLAQPVT
jgi:putative hydrolase of the HAD superfamily